MPPPMPPARAPTLLELFLLTSGGDGLAVAPDDVGDVFVAGEAEARSVEEEEFVAADDWGSVILK